MFLYQPSSGYRYNSDSIFLYDFVGSFSPRGRLLDIGCGVGIVSLLLARDFKVDITIVEKQEIMVSYARLNFELNGIEVDMNFCDISDFESKGKFDFIVSNPPFYDSRVTQSENTHINIARYAHHMPIDSLIQSVKSLLAPRGYFVFCYDAKQVDILLQKLRDAKINPEVIRFVHPKADRDAKLVLISARAGSKSMTKIMPPLIVFDEDSNYLADAKRAFQRAGTHSVSGDL